MNSNRMESGAFPQTSTEEGNPGDFGENANNREGNGSEIGEQSETEDKNTKIQQLNDDAEVRQNEELIPVHVKGSINNSFGPMRFYELIILFQHFNYAQ
ncbi:hypothetical protein O181_001955 [Austropuccinia psidii MF-1]|uniref:Uncharacterized protein n=1 Tax=Austropuccinia psidii MF-1 TaxID=1389203 RepID=A0A9Q3BC39_9BASI|nr:hypothetical protein [Austropuccinia psidii MF-1]